MTEKQGYSFLPARLLCVCLTPQERDTKSSRLILSLPPPFPEPFPVPFVLLSRVFVLNDFLALHNKLVIMPLPLLSPFGKLVQLLTIRFDFMLDLLWFLTRSKMEWRRRPIITHMRTGLELHWLLMDLCPKQNELKAFCGE